MKLYDKVLTLLDSDVGCRNSDKRLLWFVWEYQDLIEDGKLPFSNFKHCITPESITRARRQVQKDCPRLQATDPKVRKRRMQKADSFGSFAYEEEV
ncbi:hypothetical protein KAU11_09805 [Candidatus Babeliales bacterium]|nr:hypothetical protein [Candidatus Babeliales bacterium]